MSETQRFSVSGLTYPEICAIDKMLRAEGYNSRISVGALAVHISPTQVDTVNELLKPWGTSLDLGEGLLTGTAYLKPSEIRGGKK